MKYTITLLALLLTIATTAQKKQAALIRQLESNRVTLPNGWKLTPAGKSLPLGDLPLNLAVSNAEKYMAVTNNGQSVQSVQLIDLKTDKIISTAIIPKSWYGLKFSYDDKFLYASGGNDNRILKYSVSSNGLALVDSIILGDKWPNKISPAGIEVDEKTNRMYVVTKEDNSLYVIDLKKKLILKKLDLGAEAYSCILDKYSSTLFVSVWGGDRVLLINTISLDILKSIPVGDNPNEMAQSSNGRFLYVSNANDNSVSVIDLSQQRVLEVLDAAMYSDAPPGSTTNGLALSKDGSRLYIANADNNCLAVFDVTRPGASRAIGFIPVGWYPTSVKVVNRKIYVANGKGFSSKANPNGPNPARRRQQVTYQKGDLKKEKEVEYIGGLFKGTMSIIPEPTPEDLGVFSTITYRNTPYKKELEIRPEGEEGNPIPMMVGKPSPIKYVFYIVKENRTYDQVLGDMPEGNGDTSLVLFGEKFTPNQHKLAREFVLLDNFYVNGEVSADGHNWTLGAYATDYLEKTWPTSYGGRGGVYDAEGNREIANNKGGFIWDHCKKAGVSYRTYGEFADDYKANIPVLEGHFCPYYTSWDESVRDTTRFYQWKRDFDSLLAIGKVPQFNSLRFINDHTEGVSVGKPTPFAHVADNDLAVGLFVEYLSKSPIWKESVVFIVEDDAQNGPDHVDAHRTTAYLAGGYVKRKFVDHTMYSTSSMLRTIELILGLEPMSQYDAAANPMWNCFTSNADTSPFVSLPSNVDLNEKNTEVNELSRRSDKFDLSKEDAVPDLEFNEVLWYAIKGMHVPFPGPKRAAFFTTVKDEDDDD
ncbi:MAG: beta-propeller fold lactonase family protein [Flavitalea sp.]